MVNPNSWISTFRKWRRLMSRAKANLRGIRNRFGSGSSPLRGGSKFVFETLEPRLLLSADVVASVPLDIDIWQSEMDQIPALIAQIESGMQTPIVSTHTIAERQSDPSPSHLLSINGLNTTWSNTSSYEESGPAMSGVSTNGLQLTTKQQDALSAGLRSLNSTLAGLDEFGSLGTLVPFLDTSIGEHIRFGENTQSSIINPVLTVLAGHDSVSIDMLAEVLQAQEYVLSATGTVSDGGDEITFGVEYHAQATEAVGFNLDTELSVPVDVKLDADAGFDLSATTVFTLTFGLDASESFFVDIGELTISAHAVSDQSNEAPADDLNFRLSVGALSAQIVGGTIDIDVGLAIDFGDPNGDGRIDLTEFSESNYLNEHVTVAASDGALSANLPVSFTLGGFTPSVTPTITVEDANLFLDPPPEVTLSDFDELMDVDDLLANVSLIPAGVDQFLQSLDARLDLEVFAKALPLVGDKLPDTVRFIEEIRGIDSDGDGEIDTGLLAALQGTAEQTIDTVRQAVFESLGPTGLKLLADSIASAEDINFVLSPDQLAFDFELHQDLVGAAIPLDFNTGLPQLGLEVEGEGNVAVQLGFTFALGFGVVRSDDTYEFFFDTLHSNTAGDSEPELTVELGVTTPELSTVGTLGFLSLMIEDDAVSPTRLESTFSVDLTSPDGDGILTPSELTDLVVNAELDAQADVNLDLTVSFPDEARFPRLLADFELSWKFENDSLAGSVLGEIPEIAFNNVRVDLSTFVADFIGPVFERVGDVLEPIKVATDILTDDIEFLTEFAPRSFDADGDGKVELLDLASVFLGGTVDTAFIQRVVDVIDIIASVQSASGAGEIPLGDFKLIDTDVRVADLKSGSPDNNGATNPIDDVADDDTRSLLESVTIPKQQDGFQLAFPLVTEPIQAFNLLLGREADLFLLDLPRLDVSFDADFFFPVLGPIGVSLEGRLGASAELGFGYDTFGLTAFHATNDPDRLFDGFFLSDPDDPELEFFGRLDAGATLNLGLAKGTAGGGIGATVEFDLHDPNNDGKVRFSEIATDCIFDTSGSVDAGVFVSAKVGFGPFSKSFRKDLGSTTLASFSDSCGIGSAMAPPALAKMDAATGTMMLNIGSLAGQRHHAVSEENETIAIERVFVAADDTETLRVSGFGLTQEYSGVRRILGDAGSGDDTITVAADVTALVELQGGAGHDVLTGGAGDDILIGGTGDDTITGGSGEDQLSGNQGNDSLFGGIGDDTLLGGDDDDMLSGGPGNDDISGGSGADDLLGGEGSDILFGDTSDFEQANGGRVFRAIALVSDDDGDDTIVGGDEDDIIFGGGGNDTLNGNAGDDSIVADGGRFIVEDQPAPGEPQFSNFVLTSVESFALTAEQDGVDTLSGGTGNDQLWGSAQDDAILGGAGTDTVNLSAVSTTLNVTLLADDTTISDELTGNSVTANAIEQVITGAGDDHFRREAVATSVVHVDAGLGNDTLTGLNASTLWRLTADDTVEVDDVVFTSMENLVGGTSNDTFAFAPDTVLSGTISGGTGIDSLDYTALSAAVVVDLATGRASGVASGLSGGVENVYGGGGADVLTGDMQNNVLIGGADADVLTGMGGDDMIKGESGDDVLEGSAGNDSIEGGAGNDRYVFAGGALGHDTLIESDNSVENDPHDLLDFSRFIDNVAISLDSAIEVQTVSAGHLLLALQNADGFEDVIGSQFSDSIETNARDNTIKGGPGDDLLIADRTGGNDVYAFDDDWGVDAVIEVKGGGNDTFDLSLVSSAVRTHISTVNTSVIDINGNNAVLQFGDPIENVRTGSGNDEFIFGDVSTIEGFIDGGPGIDTLDYSDYEAVVNVHLGDGVATGIGGGAAGIENVLGTAGADVLQGDEHANILVGNGSNDRITGFAGDDTLEGGSGEDGLDGGSGNDLLTGGNDNDWLVGGPGSDDLRGGPGADELQGGPSDDVLEGGPGDDRSSGGTGDDRYVFSGVGLGHDRLQESGDNAANDALDTLDFHAFGGPIEMLRLHADSRQIVNSVHLDLTLSGTDVFEAVIGSGSHDVIEGNARNNVLEGGSGDDMLFGLSGDDRYVFSGERLGFDTVVESDAPASNDAHDSLDFSAFAGPARIDLEQWRRQTVHFEHLQLALTNSLGIEDVISSEFNDAIFGNARDNTYSFRDSWGRDTVFEDFDDSVNTFDLSEVTTPIVVSVSDMNVTSGNNHITSSGEKIENVVAGESNDRFDFGRSGVAQGFLDGGPGMDTLDYGSYATAMFASLRDGSASRVGGSVDNFENVVGSNKGDFLEGNDAANRLTGNGGDDRIFGLAGEDVIVVDAEFDHVDGGDALDTLHFAGQQLDITDIAGTSLLSVERIDLTGSGVNVLTVNGMSVAAIGGAQAGGSLLVTTDSEDEVVDNGSQVGMDPIIWKAATPASEDIIIDGSLRTFAVYNHTAEAATLKISECLLGDFDCDGDVDRDDLSVLMAEISKRNSVDPKFDLNGSGTTNIADARTLALLFTRPPGESQTSVATATSRYALTPSDIGRPAHALAMPRILNTGAAPEILSAIVKPNSTDSRPELSTRATFKQQNVLLFDGATGQWSMPENVRSPPLPTEDSAQPDTLYFDQSTGEWSTVAKQVGDASIRALESMVTSADSRLRTLKGAKQ